MRRFFIPPEHIHGSVAVLRDAQTVHHIRDVLRLAIGDEVACFDGQGQEYLGRITGTGADEVRLALERRAARDVSRTALWLLQAIPKGERFDWLLEKATELGVERLWPMITARTVVRVTPQQAPRKLERWRRVAQAAAQQCGRSTLPVVESLVSFEPALEAIRDVPLVVMPTLAVPTVLLADALRAHPHVDRVAVLIGPEGDFTPDEVRLAERVGAQPVSLGPLTLRSETAALAALSMLQFALAAE